MRFIAGGDWTPLPGRLVEWLPTEGTEVAARGAAPHPVPPSFLQRDHITAALGHRSENRPHRGYTASAVTVDSDLDLGLMTEAITGFLRAHEGLRSSFRVVDGQIERYVVAPDDVEMTPHDVDGLTPTQHLDASLPVCAVFDAFPGCAFGVLARRGSFDLYYGVDHAFGDGSSQILGLLEILARYRGESARPLGELTPGSHLDYTADEYARAGSVTAESESVRVWRRVLQTSGGVIPPFPLPLGVDRGPQPVVIDSAVLADPPTTAGLSEFAAAHNTSLIAAVYAALAVTYREFGGGDWYSTATVLSTRGRGEHLTSQGWYCNFAPVGFAVRGTTLAEVIDDAAAAVAASKAAADDPVHACLAVLAGEGTLDPAAAASPQMVTYLDFRWFPMPEHTRDLVVFTGEGRTRNASLWISRDADVLRISTQRPDNPIAAASVATFFAAVRGVLRAGIVSPSGVH